MEDAEEATVEVTDDVSVDVTVEVSDEVAVGADVVSLPRLCLCCPVFRWSSSTARAARRCTSDTSSARSTPGN